MSFIWKYKFFYFRHNNNLSTYHITFIFLRHVSTCVDHSYRARFKKMDSISYVYIFWTIHDLHIISKMISNFSNTLEQSPSASHAAASVENKMVTMQHKIFAFVSSLKLLCSVRFVFVSTFNLQRGRAFVVGITNLSKQTVCVKTKAPADHVYQSRTWDEFKRVLSVAHASQPVERAENLEYRNCLACVEAPFTVQLSPSFWITLYNTRKRKIFEIDVTWVWLT